MLNAVFLAYMYVYLSCCHGIWSSELCVQYMYIVQITQTVCYALALVATVLSVCLQFVCFNFGGPVHVVDNSILTYYIQCTGKYHESVARIGTSAAGTSTNTGIPVMDE